ncbi:NINE protein [Winogradskyella maritima]|uniref:NINE protein n=1 Tax=Winogradskyella maritima TaxID=1517766 RepID=A0ABV8AES4_9FLAO|nr:NINE protein [Winogradskyella maritima]
MSDDNKNLGDDLNDMLGDAKESAKKASEQAKEFASEAKEKASEFSKDAQSSAKEFSESAKETFSSENKKVLAGVLAILLGGLGIHKFILGYTKEGIIILVATIILSIITCGIFSGALWILGLIEGIIYLTKTDEEFYNTYQVGHKPWF